MTLSADQKTIRDEARRLLADKAGREALRARIETKAGADAALWALISGELGWTAMAIPEAQGGLDLGMVEVALLMEEAGRALPSVPLWSSLCLATPLLYELGQDARLEAIASGALTATLALPQAGALDGGLAAPLLQAQGNQLPEGELLVIEAALAQEFLIPAMVEGKVAIFALPREAVEITPLQTMDETRDIARLRITDGALAERLDHNGLAPHSIDLVCDTARLGLAAEQIGLAAALLDMTLDYITERVQFGRTIASFQAVKHRMAALQVQLAESRSLAWGAASHFATRPPEARGLEVSALKAMADDLAKTVAREAIQLHGGVAMTWEYDPHFFLKRAQSSALLLGQSDAHYERIAASLLDRRA